MFKTRVLLYISIFWCFIFGSVSFAQKTPASAPTPKEVIFKMIKSIQDLERLKYSLKIVERGKKGYNHYESSVKLNRKPRKIYLYIKGIELLWVAGWNNNKAYVKPNSFPYINLSLDPLGFLMRQDQHHTLNEMGVDYFGSVIEYIALKYGDKFDQYFKLEGEERIKMLVNLFFVVLNYFILIDNSFVTHLDTLFSKIQLL